MDELLNAGALSRWIGESGYDGAIDYAEREGHFAVTELIRSYTREFSIPT